MLRMDLTGRPPYGMTRIFLEKLLSFAYERASGRGSVVVSVSLIDDRVMRQLNWRHRGKKSVTDVLSFAYDEIDDGWPKEKDQSVPAVRTLGEIVICLPQVRRQAKKIGRKVAEETSLMAVHGLLHLMGFDHVTLEDEKEMFGLQQEILFERGIIYQS